MERVQIQFRGDLLGWLEARPVSKQRSEAVAISLRSAIRAFPHWASRMDEPWAVNSNLNSLPLLRAFLSASVAVVVGTDDLVAPTFNAARMARSAGAVAQVPDSVDLDDVAFAAFGVAYSGAETKFRSIDSSDQDFAAFASDADAADFAVTLLSNSRYGSIDSNESVVADLSMLLVGFNLTEQPLWHGDAPPLRFRALESEARAIWARDPDTWSFWLRWWDGVLSGNQLDWELQKQVALIPDPIWQAGPEAVAQAIREFEERFALQRRAAALRAEFEALTAALTQQASLEQRSHNHPPALVEVAPPVQVQIGALTTALHETEVELARQAPDKPILLKLAVTLRDGAAAILRYCGSLTDTALQEVAKSVGKWGGAALTIYLATEPVMKGLASLAEAILSHLAKFP